MNNGQLNSLEATILRILEGHQGREYAVSRTDLVERVNDHWPLFPVSERSIRKMIKHLTTQHGFAIGSGSGGYFMAVTADEIEGVCHYYRSYGLSSLFVEAKLRKMSLPKLLGQLSLDLGG